VSREQAPILRQAYFACVSYIDAQIGKILDELRELELEQNTVVALWSDHGWHLGEHGMWGKQTNFEVATRSPLIVRVPGMPHAGVPTKGLAETVDVYPTLADLCGLATSDELAGTSLVPVLEDPSCAVKNEAMSFHPCYKNRDLLGCTLRTDRYRIVEWVNRRTKEVAQVELYDHQIDPQEDDNIATENPTLVDKLLERLHQITPSLKNI
jgi:arylsulfatase A-like enzyme